MFVSLSMIDKRFQNPMSEEKLTEWMIKIQEKPIQFSEEKPTIQDPKNRKKSKIQEKPWILNLSNLFSSKSKIQTREIQILRRIPFKICTYWWPRSCWLSIVQKLEKSWRDSGLFFCIDTSGLSCWFGCLSFDQFQSYILCTGREGLPCSRPV